MRYSPYQFTSSCFFFLQNDKNNISEVVVRVIWIIMHKYFRNRLACTKMYVVMIITITLCPLILYHDCQLKFWGSLGVKCLDMCVIVFREPRYEHMPWGLFLSHCHLCYSIGSYTIIFCSSVIIVFPNILVHQPLYCDHQLIFFLGGMPKCTSK